MVSFILHDVKSFLRAARAKTLAPFLPLLFYSHPTSTAPGNPVGFSLKCSPSSSISHLLCVTPYTESPPSLSPGLLKLPPDSLPLSMFNPLKSSLNATDTVLFKKKIQPGYSSAQTTAVAHHFLSINLTHYCNFALSLPTNQL